jgi:glutathione S-transferase
MGSIALVGRSSSHFTRVARIFALELGVEHAFRPVLDLTVLDAAAYAGNPALKIPILVDDAGALFGAENVCRDLARRSGRRADVVLREDVKDRVVANAEELTLHAMSTEVSLVMAQTTGGAASPKAMPSIENCLCYLDEHVGGVLAALPQRRAISFAEVALFCLVTHLPFRNVLDVSRWEKLEAFRARFGERASACTTAYRFDTA